jgi:26S proteasome regulatory subunit T4
MDEIDAIGGRRFSEGTSADREIQRTLMELLNQMDGFDQLGKVKIIMATNRPDTLDPALLRPGRLDRKIEIGLPNEAGRVEVLKIHASKIKHADDIGMCVCVCVTRSVRVHANKHLPPGW